ncbi:allantoinase AllB [Cryobacterium sp. PH31-L1]|uniref:allantoinase AllB n=1 Tax=Cryobacterium sp. PH31-L1 TaxID=3046199 RepID=UPI0024BB4BD0|nr:allantoinase AllB [Cryobacterium sp. PH31-L1]MDJ0378163.1 allantoinase AllB [Cryobacterium sp. PH31-L1]
MTYPDLVIRSERVLTAQGFIPAAVCVTNGVITAILPIDAVIEGPPRADAATPDQAPTAITLREERLAPDAVLIPGLVDTHVHVNEPGRTEWEGFASATLAAAAGGVTTIIDMPLNSIPPTVSVTALERKRQAAGAKASVHVGFWGGAIPANLGKLHELSDAGVFGFKVFLSPSGVDEFPNLSLTELEAAAVEIAVFGGQLLVHAEDPQVLDGSVNGGGDGYRDFVASRPPEAETTAIEQVIEVVRRTGVRAHILHLSSGKSLPLLRAAKGAGLPITAETCPHYLYFSAECIPDGATSYKCCPPIRDEANRALLWAGLGDGTIDFIASDHSPATRELKLGHGGDFGLAWGGISGLQLSLAAVWSAGRARGVGLEQVVEWMSTVPARFLGLAGRDGLAGKGAIAVGADADLVAFAPAEDFLVDAESLRHKNKVSAFDGALLVGRVRTTWLAGREVFSVHDDVAGRPTGALLAR